MPLAAVRRHLRVWRHVAVALAVLVVGLAGTAALAQTDDAPGNDDHAVEILPVEGFLDPPVAGAIRDLVREADAGGSELVVIQLDAPGAVSADLEGLLATVTSSSVPVAVFVGPLGVGAEAAGGAAALALGADVLAVAGDARVGPLHPLDLAGEQTLDARLALPPAAAEALRSGDGLAAPALIDTTAADLVVAGLEPLLVELDGTTVTTAAGDTTLALGADELRVRFHSLGLLRRMLHAATTAPFIYLLFTVGLAMLAFEVFQPGFGVAGIAGGIMAAIGVFGLTVLPVTWWAVALVVVGLGLYMLDTAVAGLGPVTVAATAAFGAGSWWFYAAPVLALPAWLVVTTTLAALVFFVLVMTVVLRAQAGPEGADLGNLVGKVGVVRSVLNPEGHVYVDGALWRARWTGEQRRAKVGTPVAVHAVDGPVLLVEPASAPDSHGRPRVARSS